MSIIKDSLKAAALLALAYVVSDMLIVYTGMENNSALVYVAAIVVISRFTDGYVYGIVSSVISVFFVNYYFMYPFETFNLSMAGYPIALLSMLLTSLIVSTLTSRTKQQTVQNERLYKMQAEMKVEAEKEEIRANLLRAISHDLRTPLTGILGASSVMLENTDSLTKKEVIQFAANIQEDVQWLINMVENILSVTRIGENGAAIKERDEVLEEIVSEAMNKIKKRFPDYKIRVEPSDEILIVPMDAMLIQQVIINLVENSIRHSGDKENIRISTYRDGDMAVFQVADRGRGINCENIDKLIEDVIMNSKISADATRGSGMGLSVCKSILKAHGGFIEAENNPEGGAFFRFGLKMKEVVQYGEQTNDIGD